MKTKTPLLNAYRKEKHKQDMTDPIYRKGYEAKNFFNDEIVNPHRFPTSLNLKQIKIASKVGPLTQEEKKQLGVLIKKWDATPYARWSRGNYARWVLKLT